MTGKGRKEKPIPPYMGRPCLKSYEKQMDI